MADNANITTKTELLKTQASEQVKQHLVFDIQDRPVFVFTCAIGTKNNEPCSVTEYVYRNPSSTQIKDRQERVSKWNAAWDANFVFDATVSYDPDGDGVL